jgi:hypothetical protein
MAVLFSDLNHHAKVHIKIFSRHHDAIAHADAGTTTNQNYVHSIGIILFEFHNFIN